jgi:hypothetical protein
LTIINQPGAKSKARRGKFKIQNPKIKEISKSNLQTDASAHCPRGAAVARE